MTQGALTQGPLNHGAGDPVAPARVDLAFQPSGTRVRVPPGVTLSGRIVCRPPKEREPDAE